MINTEGATAYFMGHEIGYWMELQKWVDINCYDTMIAEIASLRGRVSYYESRVEEMTKFKEVNG